ncbi:hypothetical protein BT69DRAFT_1280885, partial [Atractiella rhizophila]
MYFLLASLLALPAVVFGQDALVINTPSSAVECQPIAISFSGGTAPYYISVIPGGQPSAAALVQFPDQTAAGSITWTVNIAAGTAITFAIRDGDGSTNYSDQLTIQEGTSDTCLTQSASVSSAGGVATLSAVSGSDSASVSVTTSGSVSTSGSVRTTASTTVRST